MSTEPDFARRHPGLDQALRPGDLFRHPAFPRLRPTPAGFEAIPAIDGGHDVNVMRRLTGG